MLPYGSTPTERTTMARVLAALFAAGAVLVLASLALPRDHDVALVAFLGLCATALAVAGALVALGGRPGLRALQGLLAGGSVLTTGYVLAGGEGGAAYALLYAWVPAYAASFFSLRAALAEVALAATLLGGALLVAADPADDAPAVWLLAAGTLAVAGGLVSRVTAAVRQQAADLASISRLGEASAAHGEDYPQTACDGLALTLRADVAIYLAPTPGDGGLEVVAMAGSPEAGLTFSGEHARAALQRAFRSGEPAELQADAPGGGTRWSAGRKLGLAQPVVREGEVVAVLAVAWTAPRRSLPGRTQAVAQLHAAGASLAVDRARRAALDRERRALEINDNIVQGLVVAKYSAQRGDVDAAVAAIDQTLVRARRLISDQLSQVSGRGAGAIRPGDLAREAPAGVSPPPAPPPREPSTG